MLHGAAAPVKSLGCLVISVLPLVVSPIGFHVKTSTEQLLRTANAQEHCKRRGYTLQEWEAPTLTKSLH